MTISLKLFETMCGFTLDGNGCECSRKYCSNSSIVIYLLHLWMNTAYLLLVFLFSFWYLSYLLYHVIQRNWNYQVPVRSDMRNLLAGVSCSVLLQLVIGQPAYDVPVCFILEIFFIYQETSCREVTCTKIFNKKSQQDPTTSSVHCQ